MAASGNSRAYALRDGETLGTGMKRIARGRAEKAWGRLRGISGKAEKTDAVHGARRDMKKLRTVLRLLREELPKKTYRAEQERFRDAARALAVSRDAEVRLQTLERFAGTRDDLPVEAVGSWRQILTRDREAALNTDTASLAEAVALIEAGRAAIERWQLQGEGWQAVARPLARVYRHGRRDLREAEADPNEENLHQLRKRAKDLRYALELLEGLWSAPLRAAAEEAHRLTDLLGEHNDLALLRADLGQRQLGEERTRRLESAIQERQAELVVAALPLGRRLYAESPKAFGKRLGRYWATWRG
jgi:CHAD domain-containing protein